MSRLPPEERARRVAESLRTDVENIGNSISRIFQGRVPHVDITTTEALRLLNLLSQVATSLPSAITPAEE